MGIRTWMTSSSSGEDIHGDGVNIAARLRSGLADRPPGIVRSPDPMSTANRDRGKIDIMFEDLAFRQKVKNMAHEPVHVFIECES